MKISNFKFQISKNWLLIIIIILAAFLRFYQLGQNPPSLDWDEASLGYNAYSLLKTGKDEFGRVWPVSIRSFEDYKPALYTYLAIPSVWLFGLNEFATRLPSALVGTVTVLVTYFLVMTLLENTGADLPAWIDQKRKKIALLASLLLAISPWHLQFSRVAFESNVSLFFVFTGALFFLYGLRNGKWFIPAALMSALSFYTYHAPRLVVPLLLLGWTIFFWRRIWNQRYWVLGALTVGIVILIPFIHESFGAGRARLSSVTVLTAEGRLDDAIQRTEYDQTRGDLLAKLWHNRRVIYAFAVAKGYVDHFNFDFLFLRGDAPDRHHARDMGMLYFWEAPFILVGLVWCIKNRKNFFPILWWFIVAPTASSITTGTPHAVRALLYLPIYQIFATIGIFWAYNWMTRINSSSIKYGIITFGAIICFVNIFYYFQMYYVHTPTEASQDWQYGYKQAVAVARTYEASVDKIILTYAYDQPHIFVLYYNLVDPAWYQGQWRGGEVQRANRSFGKYEFRKIDWEKDRQLTNVLLIGTPNEIPAGTMGKVADIPFLDGTIAFRIVKR